MRIGVDSNNLPIKVSVDGHEFTIFCDISDCAIVGYSCLDSFYASLSSADREILISTISDHLFGEDSDF